MIAIGVIVPDIHDMYRQTYAINDIAGKGEGKCGVTLIAIGIHIDATYVPMVRFRTMANLKIGRGCKNGKHLKREK